MKRTLLPRLCDGLFSFTCAAFLLYVATDVFGFIHLSRGTGKSLVSLVIVLLPLTLVVLTAGAWMLEHRRFRIFLAVIALANLAMGSIALVISGSGI